MQTVIGGQLAVAPTRSLRPAPVAGSIAEAASSSAARCSTLLTCRRDMSGVALNDAMLPAMSGGRWRGPGVLALLHLTLPADRGHGAVAMEGPAANRLDLLSDTLDGHVDLETYALGSEFERGLSLQLVGHRALE